VTSESLGKSGFMAAPWLCENKKAYGFVKL